MALSRHIQKLHGRYDILLGLILLTIVVMLADPETDGPHLGRPILQGIVLIMAVAIAQPRERLVKWALALALFLVACDAVAIPFGADIAGGANRITVLLLVTLTPLAIVAGLVRHIRREGVTIEVMFGVLCLYILLGLVFATAYGATAEFFEPDFFQEGADTPSNFLYFSLVTLTTVGYGDLIAAGGIGRGLAVTEALIGQMYLVTVVALIVSHLRSPSASGRRKRGA